MAGAIGGAALAAGCAAAKQGTWEFLSDAQGRTLAVICDQIVPADDYPSASQAGVLTYIDRQLVRRYRRHRDAYRDGLAQADAISRRRFGKAPPELPGPRQLDLVAAIEKEDPAFFDLVRNHTLQGYYGAPRHGGNRDAVSWKMLGMDEPPLRGQAQYSPGKGAAQ
jgi:gluconate 2-dehydrogenase gamma chain